MLKVLSLGFMLTALLSLSACNTAEGLGKDIKDAGSAIEKASADAQKNDSGKRNQK